MILMVVIHQCAKGIIVLVYGITGADPFTSILFTDHPILTSILCLGKGTVAGFASGITYKLISEKNPFIGVFVASAIAPIINTGLFILGALFMADTFSANFLTDGISLIYYLVIVCAGVNFLVELSINLILAPTLSTVVKVVEKQLSVRKK